MYNTEQTQRKRRQQTQNTYEDQEWNIDSFFENNDIPLRYILMTGEILSWLGVRLCTKPVVWKTHGEDCIKGNEEKEQSGTWSLRTNDGILLRDNMV